MAAVCVRWFRLPEREIPCKGETGVRPNTRGGHSVEASLSGKDHDTPTDRRGKGQVGGRAVPARGPRAEDEPVYTAIIVSDRENSDASVS